ncbi:hypothetical protein FACS189468_0420 [Spirochaetia bacterium]|nr:hypothetical protein FACS189468_0420 [Spirochaetia bacterium]
MSYEDSLSPRPLSPIAKPPPSLYRDVPNLSPYPIVELLPRANRTFAEASIIFAEANELFAGANVALTGANILFAETNIAFA